MEDQLLEIRKNELHLTQEEIAAQIGVSQAVYQRWESKRQTPSPRSQRKLEDALAKLREDKKNSTGIYTPIAP